MEVLRPFDAALKWKAPAPAKKKPVNPLNWWKQFVFGDTDVKRSLLTKLANVAKERGEGFRIYIRSGGRTREEQAVLYAKYLREGEPLAAKAGDISSRDATGCGLRAGFPGRPPSEHRGGRVSPWAPREARAHSPGRGRELARRGVGSSADSGPKAHRDNLLPPAKLRA